MRVKCCVPEHNNVPSQGLYPDSLISREERNNHETTHLPQLTTPSTKRFFWSEILCRLQSCTATSKLHCESLEIKFLSSKLKGRKRGNVYFLEIFSNTPTTKEENLTEIDSFSWQNVQEYNCHMDSTDQYSLILCGYNIDVVEIIHGQFLTGFLLSQRRKNVGEVFFWEIPV